ncbi:MAG TPA: amidohydrolase family protein [Flavitalea sp.]|nr:amidohydrolase family protein [Flavitalea sp.]
MKTINLSFIGALLLLSTLEYCSEPPAKSQEMQYYTVNDYDTVDKFDTHVHINTNDSSFIEMARRNKFNLVSLNVAAPGYPTIEDQQNFTTRHLKNYPSGFAYTTTFNIEHLDDKNWASKTLAYLKSSFERGAIGVKVWKNIGMEYKNKDGKFVMIDNFQLDTIFDFIEANDKTLVGHLGEPRNCWLPLDQMTVKNDHDYFKEHPEYHMFLHPDYPSYEDQINARDHMLRKHPKLRFDGAHLGSLEWNLGALSKHLDSFPEMAVDMAARIPHIQYLTQKDRDSVYDFFIKYQDRMLYATDTEIDDSMDIPKKLKEFEATWKNNWQFFVTDDSLQVAEVEGKFRGLHLPKEVVDKIYRKNAMRWFPAFKINE